MRLLMFCGRAWRVFDPNSGYARQCSAANAAPGKTKPQLSEGNRGFVGRKSIYDIDHMKPWFTGPTPCGRFVSLS